jgi:hypothetical protein
MDQEKPNPTPSRTLRVPQGGYDEKKYDYKSTLNGNVYFLTFDEIADAVLAYQKLRDDKVPVRYHVYSLFVKFDEVLTNEQLSDHINKVLSTESKNVTYIRVDPSNHTGKVVVDRLDDCKTLLAYRDTASLRLRFYRFDPKKAIKRLDTPTYDRPPRTLGTNDDGFTKVEHKKRAPVTRKTGLYKNTAKYEPKSKA